MSKIKVIIPAYRRRKPSGMSLKIFPPAFQEVIVINNNSTDNTVK
jgi:glycosyltransferase involved in cell wall biosynthesis